MENFLINLMLALNGKLYTHPGPPDNQ